MKFAVIGSRGFIGSHCVSYFLDQGHDVVEIDRRAVAGMTYAEIFKEQQFDCIINAAGSAFVSRSFEYPQDDFRDNVGLVEELLSAVQASSPDCKFIQLSSAAVYGNPDQLPINESAATKPLSPYGEHKLKSEQLVKDYYERFKVGGVSLRIFSSFGEGLKRQLFWDLYKKTLRSNSVELKGTGAETRDFIYVKDLVRAIEAVATKAEFKGEVYNIANGEAIAIRDAAKTFLREMGWKGQLRFSNKPHKGYPTSWQADITKLKQLGYTQSYTFEEGIRNYCKWLERI